MERVVSFDLKTVGQAAAASQRLRFADDRIEAVPGTNAYFRAIGALDARIALSARHQGRVAYAGALAGSASGAR
ncbi:hypothetical protein, partial [Paraburkholderia unamae]|uniref:hypothetical protein n=1 Tax=Paraburkholderia unamae TaxID=219649 RepID=UPI001CC5324E